MNMILSNSVIKYYCINTPANNHLFTKRKPYINEAVLVSVHYYYPALISSPEPLGSQGELIGWP